MIFCLSLLTSPFKRGHSEEDKRQNEDDKSSSADARSFVENTINIYV